MLDLAKWRDSLFSDSLTLQHEYLSGPNFAGHYVVLHYRHCGTNCNYFAVADVRTGRLTAYPKDAPVGLAYRLDSRLLIEGLPAQWYDAWGSEPIPEGVHTYYWHWTGTSFELIDSIAVAPRR